MTALSDTPALPFTLYLPTADPLRPVCLTVTDETSFRQAINISIAVGIAFANGWYLQAARLHGVEYPYCPYDGPVESINALNPPLPPDTSMYPPGTTP